MVKRVFAEEVGMGWLYKEGEFRKGAHETEAGAFLQLSLSVSNQQDSLSSYLSLSILSLSGTPMLSVCVLTHMGVSAYVRKCVYECVCVCDKALYTFWN